MPETKVKKNEDFNEWYNEIVELAELCDKRYPIKGMNIWRPYGWSIMQNIDRLIRKEMVETGHLEVYFPLLIPESLFKKEEEHIEGFSSEVFWVTHAGENPLEERWLLRPTSETAMYPIFSLWVRSHSDLPLKTFQIVNTFRYETKQTRAFIRVREIHFFEAHTCHRDFKDAERQIKEDLVIAERFFKQLSLPYILNRRPEWDKFAGAYYTISIDVMMPSGRTLQLGSIHQYRDNFAKPYNIRYEDIDGKHKYCHQTTYGMSERILGAIVGIHGDDRGLILPPSITPIQVIIIPIIFKGKEEIIKNECKKVEKILKDANIRAQVDLRDITPGNKYYDWELKGVPLRIEIGPKEIENKQVMAVRRDNFEKIKVDKKTLVEEIPNILDSISSNMYKIAKDLLDKSIKKFEDIDKAKEFTGIIELPWCGNNDCALKMEEILDVKTLGIPIEQNQCDKTCPVCKKPAKNWVRLAKTY
ncbi:MAG: proline--tRNA ligase [Thermoplasmata archaeon]|nr:MAG: proline--tRNA ligase [Thermoplasmata archaeon]